jgi:hypothetical protein
MTENSGIAADLIVANGDLCRDHVKATHSHRSYLLCPAQLVYSFGTGARTAIFMVNKGIAGARRWWPGWEWMTGPLVVVSLVSCSRLGHQLPMAVQDVAFLIVVATPMLLTAMAWVGLANGRRDGNVPRWRIWISLCGCVALSLALAITWIAFFSPMLFHFDWLRLVGWCLASTLVSLLTGIFAARSVRFPLIFGGLIMGGLVVIIPVGIL